MVLLKLMERLLNIKMKKQKLKVLFSQYLGVISVRVYDPKAPTMKTVAKIELSHLSNYINEKLKVGKYKVVYKGKGNSLPIIELK
jgi:hypothetical protein